MPLHELLDDVVKRLAEPSKYSVPGVPGVPRSRPVLDTAASSRKDPEHADTRTVFRVSPAAPLLVRTDPDPACSEHREHASMEAGVPVATPAEPQTTAPLPRLEHPEHPEHPEHRFSMLARSWDVPEERAAIMEYDGGLTREEAEAQAWPAAAWHRLYRARLTFWALPRAYAYGVLTRHLHPYRLAWSDLQNLWHKRHGEQVPPGICAGCGEPIGDSEALALCGYQTHIGREPDCLTLHGNRWRAAADDGLRAFGLSPPTESEPEVGE